MQTKNVVKRSVSYILGPVAWVARSATYLFIKGIISTVISAAVYFLSLVALRAVKEHDIILLHDYLGLKRVSVWMGRVVAAEQYSTLHEEV